MKVLFLLLAVFLSVNGLEEPVKKITIDPEKDPETKLFISDLASDIRYIKLETSPECMLDRIRKVVLDKDLIFILSSSSPSGHLFIFSNTGKFIRQIGKQGRGPGEYSSIIDFSIDKKGKRIYLIDTMGNLFIYGFSGEYINREKVLSEPAGVCYSDNHLFFLQCWPTYFQNNGFAITVRDPDHKKPDLKLINRQYIKFDKIIQDVLFYINFSLSANNENSITLLESKFDTLYSITAQGVVRPEYVIDLKNKMPQNIFFIDDYTAAHKKYNTYDQIIETSSYIIMIVVSKQEFYLYLYNKNNGELLRQNTNKLTQFIYNDYDGGLSFSPGGLADLNVIYAVQSSSKIERKLAEEPMIRIKNPGANSNLKELVKNSDENDNPTLVFLTLKH